MNLKDLVENAKTSAPALASVPNGKAVALLREVFRQIVLQVGEANEGVVNVAGLGRFKVKVGEKERAGEKVATRRVMFKAVPAKKGKAGGKGGAGKRGKDGVDRKAGAGKAGEGRKAKSVKAGKGGKGGKADKAGKGGGKVKSVAG